MADNKDIAVLAKKVYELSTLALVDLEARKWEALLIVNAVTSSATHDGVATAHADKEARRDLHRLGIAGQNRALVCAAVSGALGVLCGIGIGLSIRKN